MPGWRVGWLVLQGKGTGRLNELATGIRNLSQIILGEVTGGGVELESIYMHWVGSVYFSSQLHLCEFPKLPSFSLNCN